MNTTRATQTLNPIHSAKCWRALFAALLAVLLLATACGSDDDSGAVGNDEATNTGTDDSSSDDGAHSASDDAAEANDEAEAEGNIRTPKR